MRWAVKLANDRVRSWCESRFVNKPNHLISVVTILIKPPDNRGHGVLRIAPKILPFTPNRQLFSNLMDLQSMNFGDVSNLVLSGIALCPVHSVGKGICEGLKLICIFGQVIKYLTGKLFVFIAVVFTQPVHKGCLGVSI